jgi:CxxC motif-containing protein (DUF1111 family)
MTRIHAVAAVVAGVVALAAGCGNGTADRAASSSPPVPAFLTVRNGGPTTARALRGRPYNQSARNLDNAGLARFARGAEPFDQAFDPGDGLGPDHDRTGCLSCHLDGTRAPEHPTDGPPPGFIVRVSLPGTDGHGGPRPVPTYGLQLTPAATGGGEPEATVRVRWTTVVHRTADGRRVELRRPVLDIRPHRGPLPAGVETSPRMAPAMIGLGLLEAIPEPDLVAAAARQAADGSGVSGRVNRVADPLSGDTVLGRFGWKAGQPSVESQTLAALHTDLGISTPDSVAPGATPELDADSLADLVFYNQTIAVPIGRGVSAARVRRGAATFQRIGCAACHTPTQRTDAAGGPDHLAALAGVTFHPYTDLLLHDMGAGLADGRREYLASGREWRTAPLWGLSRRVEVTGVRAFLHDGRARTPEEAILWHGGEAGPARVRFERLSAGDRADLLAFLDSL